MWLLYEAYDQVLFFMDRGGWVLQVLMLVIGVMWVFILERMLFFWRVSRALESNFQQQWQSRPERHSWLAHQVRNVLLADFKLSMNRYLPLIKVLVSLCPLLGLLGTVTGMIEVFDVMSLIGNSSPKAMASGISKATIPTMAGMVGALTGIFAHVYLKKVMVQRCQHMEETLVFDH